MIEKIQRAKYLSDYERYSQEYLNLLVSLGIEFTNRMEERKKIIEIFESEKKNMITELEGLTLTMIQNMEIFTRNSRKFLDGGFVKSAKTARGALNSIAATKSIWNRKSLILS